jgi:hypothetical protein
MTFYDKALQKLNIPCITAYLPDFSGTIVHPQLICGMAYTVALECGECGQSQPMVLPKEMC